MDVQIPSPSIFLQRSPPSLSTIESTTARKSKSRGTALPKVHTRTNSTFLTDSGPNSGITKPKQSKSRNGCMTCKKKRLKCDETKPTCVQCERRNVECEGYKKDYKWRTFEETSKQSRVGKCKKAATISVHSSPEGFFARPPQISRAPIETRIPIASTWTPCLKEAHATTQPLRTSASVIDTSLSKRFSPSQFAPLPILNPGFSPSDLDLPSALSCRNGSIPSMYEDGGSQSPFSSGSPNLVDLLLPGTDMSQPPDSSELRPPMSPLPYSPGLAEASTHLGITIQGEGSDDEFDEEVIREHIHRHTQSGMTDQMNDHLHAHIMSTSDMQWSYRTPSPALSDVSSSSSLSTTSMSILRPPALEISSPEMLILQFDKETCGILSIKDGPSENPWRTSIWPLAKDSQALYHAISSMAALHGAMHNPELRLAGMAHMTKSLSKLSTELQHMSLDQALATSLALALGEGWDDRVSTGIQHLRGAKILLNRAIVQKTRNDSIGHLDQEGAKRLRFLCHTYVYMDVIARLASIDNDDTVDLGALLDAVNVPFDNGVVTLDPLMGCATTLFPLIGKVASLVQQVRSTNQNSLRLVSEANELKEQLFDWSPPHVDHIERPEDPYSNVKHAIQTAEAYRCAILLHLQQAVPELVSEAPYTQAKRILTILAGTPLSSRTMIVQIFPLLVGSCEMVSKEDREWACQRWSDMMRRLAIVNVTSCWKLVQEVWRRRDAHAEDQVRKLSSRVIGRDVLQSLFVPPSLKRKSQSFESLSEDLTSADSDQNERLCQYSDARPSKRRLTFDTFTASDGGRGTDGRVVHHNRRLTDVTAASIGPEYTVRGHLHWLDVMSGWRWEVFLG